MNRAEVGVALAGARRRAGLSQAELARRMGTSQSAVSRAEAGWTTPSLGLLERWVRATEQSVRIGDLVIGPASAEAGDETRRRARVDRVLGGYTFNPWDRNPSDAEQRSLVADGLTREYFEGTTPAE